MPLPFRSLTTLLLAALTHGAVGAAEAQVAVAANFAEPMKALAALLEKTTGHTLKISTGASGAIYTQIRNGAPFDAFLSADNERPERLEQDGLAQPGTRFTYATGRLVLWSAKAGRVDDQGAVLRAADLGKVALANPRTAPYGAAALQVIQQLGLSAAITPRLVQGESIGQTFAFVTTGNADVGFVALSQVLEGGRLKAGSMWLIPQTLYEPIRQDAVLLKRGAGNEAARALLQLLKSADGQALIRAAGYDL
jgi:molybdate transport system substrate-binding protein